MPEQYQHGCTDPLLRQVLSPLPRQCGQGGGRSVSGFGSSSFSVITALSPVPEAAATKRAGNR